MGGGETVYYAVRIFPDRIRVRNHNLQTGRQRLKQYRVDYDNGNLSATEILHSLQSWNAHLTHADSWRLRQQIFADLPTWLPLE